MAANILLADSPDPGDGVNRSKLNFFSEHGDVAYQIKENHECSNMVANILSTDHPTPDPPPPDPVGGVKRSFFSENGHVAYQIR